MSKESEITVYWEDCDNIAAEFEGYKFFFDVCKEGIFYVIKFNNLFICHLNLEQSIIDVERFCLLSGADAMATSCIEDHKDNMISPGSMPP